MCLYLYLPIFFTLTMNILSGCMFILVWQRGEWGTGRESEAMCPLKSRLSFLCSHMKTKFNPSSGTKLKGPWLHQEFRDLFLIYSLTSHDSEPLFIHLWNWWQHSLSYLTRHCKVQMSLSFKHWKRCEVLEQNTPFT